MINFILGACTNQLQPHQNEATEVSITSPHPWSYSGETGPKNWGKLDPTYATCSEGKEQSPININHSKGNNATNIEVHYEPTNITLENDGHTIVANTETKSSSVNLTGSTYLFEQFHFHTPSEHQINGKYTPMELHLVHKDKNGKIAVIGIMIQEGKENKALNKIWAVLPKDPLKLEIKEAINVKALLPKNQTSFLYKGSLTTPPCTEKVQWVLFEQSIEMSKEQIKKFQEIFPDNHRPVQPINERDIFKTKIKVGQ
jgi:carbonic anhydrase